METGIERLVALESQGGPEAEELAHRLKLEGIVRRLGPVSNTWSLLAAADVFVSTSPAEGGFPFAILEALCSGTPVVATDIPPHRHGARGIAACRLAPLEPSALAAAIVTTMARNAEDAASEAAIARSRIVEQYGLGDWVGRMLSRYEQVLAERVAGHS